MLLNKMNIVSKFVRVEVCVEGITHDVIFFSVCKTVTNSILVSVFHNFLDLVFVSFSFNMIL